MYFLTWAGATTEKNQQLRKNLCFLKDLHPLQLTKLAEAKVHVIFVVLVLSTLPSTEEAFG